MSSVLLSILQLRDDRSRLPQESLDRIVSPRPAERRSIGADRSPTRRSAMQVTRETRAVGRQRGCGIRDLIAHRDSLLREGILKLLDIKDSDIRASILEQGRDSVDQG